MSLLYQPNQAEARQGLEFFDNLPLFARTCSTVIDKQGAEIPHVISAVGLRVWEAIKRQQAARQPVRIIVLKSRQVFASTAIAYIIWKVCAFLAGQRALCIGNDADTSANVFGYYKHFQESYDPVDLGRAVLACNFLEKDNTLWLKYREGSEIRVRTAGAKTAGRSFRFNLLHATEVAFWEHQARVFGGLLQSVTASPYSMAFMESTANGVGNYFNRTWCDAIAGKNEWLPVFLAWFEHYENQMRLDVEPAEFQAKLTQDEQEMAQKYRLSLEQLNWRRWCIRNRCGGDPMMFKQEHPSFWEEAFLTTGRARFPSTTIARHPVIEDPIEGELEEERQGSRTELVFIPQERGALKIWKRPTQGKRYVIGSDIAEGIDKAEISSGTPDPDYCVATVLELETGEQVASRVERCEPDLWGLHLYDLGRLYNWAFLGPEANSVGVATISKLLDLGYPLELICQRAPRPEKLVHPRIQDLGLLTSQVTRPQMMSQLSQALRDFTVIIRSARTRQELFTFVYQRSGREEADVGQHDDEVMALAHAVEARKRYHAQMELYGQFKPDKTPPDTGEPTYYGPRGRLAKSRQLLRRR